SHGAADQAWEPEQGTDIGPAGDIDDGVSEARPEEDLRAERGPLVRHAGDGGDQYQRREEPEVLTEIVGEPLGPRLEHGGWPEIVSLSRHRHAAVGFDAGPALDQHDGEEERDRVGEISEFDAFEH